MKSINGSRADEVVTVGHCWRLSLRILAAVAAAIVWLTKCLVCAPIEWLTANRNVNRLYALLRYKIMTDTIWCACLVTCSTFSSSVERLDVMGASNVTHFHSRLFHPCYMVPRFPLRRFQSPLQKRLLIKAYLLHIIKNPRLLIGKLGIFIQRLAFRFDVVIAKLW